MSSAFEGDLIRPLGLLTLYAAYAEGELDTLIEALLVEAEYGNAQRQLPLGRKLSMAINLAKRFNSPSLDDLVGVIENGRVLFNERNALIHGQLYGEGRLVSNRRDVPDRKVSPESIDALSNAIFAWKEKLFVHRCRYLLPLLDARGKNGA